MRDCLITTYVLVLCIHYQAHGGEKPSSISLPSDVSSAPSGRQSKDPYAQAMMQAVFAPEGLSARLKKEQRRRDKLAYKKEESKASPVVRVESTPRLQQMADWSMACGTLDIWYMYQARKAQERSAKK